MRDGSADGLDSDGSDPVEALMAPCFEAPEAEQASRFTELVASHPEHADEIRSRLAALRAIGLVAGDPRGDLPETLGEFRLGAKLGEGGMGVVVRARQTSLDREVALKLVRPDLLFLPSARERFRREVLAISKLQHPGIVPVYAVGEERGIPFFAMELVEGVTLAQCLVELAARAPSDVSGADLAGVVARRTGAPCVIEPGSIFERPWVEACVEIARQIADALAHAHERGLLHRDVKPSNVMLTRRGRALLLDFGLTSAESNDRLTRSGAQLGTLQYMSPEQVRGERLDATSDVYSVGATLHELLTLRAPFDGPTAHSIQTAILAGLRASVRTLNPRVGADVETVCSVALELERGRRYASAAALARDLEHVLAHEPIEARPVGAAVRSARWVRRHPTASVGVLAAVVLAVGIPSALLAQKTRYATTLERSLKSEQDALAKQKIATEDAESTLLYLTSIVQSAKPDEGGAQRTLEQVLADMARSVDQLASRPGMQARALLLLGDSYRALGRYDEAIPLLERAVEVEEKTNGHLGEYALLALNSLATAVQRAGRTDDAVKLFRRALEGQSRLNGGVGSAVAAIECNLGGALYDQQSFVEAVEHIRRAVELYAADGKASDAHRAIASMSLATMLIDLGELDEASAVVERCRAELDHLFGKLDVSRGQFFVLAGNVALARKEFESAESSYADALAMYHELYGERHPDIPVVLINQGRLREAQGRREEALVHYDEAEAMLKALDLANHPYVEIIHRRREALTASER
ncbi:MAG: serine/threonine-protein kinase [Planctomycetes bacterium]|nr:serine/threonine-protein kinase [Planctomycetota bacterium]